MELTKVCSICSIEKSLDEFYRQTDERLGRHSSCKDCRNTKERQSYDYTKARAKRLKHNYGMSLEDYAKLLELQSGVCAICKSIDENLHVDHDHVTGKVRGLLCNSCDTGLGHLKDSTNILLSAVEYLQGSMG